MLRVLFCEISIFLQKMLAKASKAVLYLSSCDVLL